MRGDPDAIREALRWVEPEVDAVRGGQCRIRLRTEAREWLVTQVAMVAVSIDVLSVAPADVAADVSSVAARLAAVGAD